MAAAAGGFEPVVPVDRQIFKWYVENHQMILRKMLEGVDNRVRYYGGFSLNIAVGAWRPGRSGSRSPPGRGGRKSLFEYYEIGHKYVKEGASDIDAKILGVDAKDEYTLLRKMLRDGRAPTAPVEIEEAAHNIVWAATEGADHGTGKQFKMISHDVNILFGPGQLGGTPIQYIIGHIKRFSKEDGYHYQLILTAIYSHGGMWKMQVLSELTPVPDHSERTDPLFTNTDFVTLRAQFSQLRDYLLAQSPSTERDARLLKTQKRLRALAAMLSPAFVPPSTSTTHGGGRTRRRRRRGSVKN